MSPPLFLRQERFLSSYPAKQVASIDLDGTVYAVSAFYLCAKKLKVRVRTLQWRTFDGSR